MPDNKTLYVLPAMNDLDSVHGGETALILLPGGTKLARSMLDYPEGDQARASICALRKLADTCRDVFWERFPKGSDIAAEQTRLDWEEWKEDTIEQLTEKLRDLMAAEPEELGGEMEDDESRGRSSSLQDGAEVAERSITHDILRVEMVDQDTWMRWNAWPNDYNHSLLYKFSKTPAEAELTWFSASMKAPTHPATTAHPLAKILLRDPEEGSDREERSDSDGESESGPEAGSE